MEKPEPRIYTIKNEVIQSIRDELKIKAPICLVGGLGDLSLYSDVLDALENKINLYPQKYYILTSPEINIKFQKLISSIQSPIKMLVREFDYMKVLRGNYDVVFKDIEEVINENIYEYEIICELTGGTKPVTIALIMLGKEYGLKRYYFTSRDIIEVKL